MTEDRNQRLVRQGMSLSEVIDFVQGGRRTIGIVVLLSVLAGFVVIWGSQKQYEASAMYAPINDTSSFMQQSQAVRSLVNLARPGLHSPEDVTPFEKFQVLLTSQAISDRIVQQHPDILQKIFSGEWDKENKRWVQPHGPTAIAMRSLKSLFGTQTSWSPPNGTSLAGYLQQRLKLSFDQSSGLLTLSYRAGDRAFANMMLYTVAQTTDDVLRSIARSRTDKRIAYLKKILPEVTAADQRAALIELLSQEEQNSLTIEADRNYAAEALTLPNAGPRPVWPQPRLILLASLLVGIFLGAALHYLAPQWDFRRLPSLWSGFVSSLRTRALGSR